MFRLTDWLPAARIQQTRFTTRSWPKLSPQTITPIVITDTDGSGTITLTGNAFLTGLSTGISVGDKVTYSGKLEGTGALVSS